MKTILSDCCASIHWVVVHHHDWDIPWESLYATQEEAELALGSEPGGQIFRVIPRPLPKGEVKFIHKEW